jgi:hypothetical protein
MRPHPPAVLLKNSKSEIANPFDTSAAKRSRLLRFSSRPMNSALPRRSSIESILSFALHTPTHRDYFLCALARSLPSRGTESDHGYFPRCRFRRTLADFPLLIRLEADWPTPTMTCAQLYLRILSDHHRAGFDNHLGGFFLFQAERSTLELVMTATTSPPPLIARSTAAFTAALVTFVTISARTLRALFHDRSPCGTDA